MYHVLKVKRNVSLSLLTYICLSVCLCLFLSVSLCLSFFLRRHIHYTYMYMMSNIVIHTLSRALIRWTFVNINHYISYILHVEIVEVYWHTVSSSSHQMLEELQKTYRPIDSQYQHIYQLCFFSVKSNYSNIDMIFMSHIEVCM